jgi:hypothetical protein
VKVAPITISRAGVAPTSGTASTPFTFSATYKSTNGSDPTAMAAVYIDNLAYSLTAVSGSSANGALYQFTTTLAAGSHPYFFVFANANDRWASPTDPATFSLTVSPTSSSAAGTGSGSPARSGASPAFAHVLLAPNYSSDPDQSPYPAAKDARSTGVLPRSADFPDDEPDRTRPPVGRPTGGRRGETNLTKPQVTR